MPTGAGGQNPRVPSTDSPSSGGRLDRTGASQELDSFIRAVMELVHEGTATLDTDGKLLKCSARLAEMLGWPVEQLNGRSFVSFVASEHTAKWRAAFDALGRQGAARAEMRLIGSGGRAAEVSVGLCAAGGPGGPAALLVASDVAAQRERLAQLERMLSKMEKQRDELEQAATTDSITGAYSAGAVSEVLRPELAYSRRYDETVSLLVADIDDFKDVNDTYGHPVGDIVLREFCERCRRAVRTTDYLIRYGGDEFVVVLPRTDASGAQAAANRIWSSIRAKAFVEDTHRLPVTVSVGVATALPGEALTPEEFVHRADLALYEVKRGGKDGVCTWTPETSDVAGEERNPQ